MSLPTFPEVPKDFTCENSISQILTSIAMEEIGLSHILNAEGEKLQYILGTLEDSKPPIPPTIDQVLEVNQSVKDMLQQVAFNQMFLSAKMSDALKACMQFKKMEKEECDVEIDPPTDPDRPILLEQPNSYELIEKGQYRDMISSTVVECDTSNPAIVTATIVNEHPRVHGVGAGAAVIAIANHIGLVIAVNFQVFDPEKIGEYTMKTGGKVFFDGIGQIKPCPVTTTPMSAHDDIKWVSLNPSVAEVMPNGDIKSIKKGAAVIIGTFTDKWGVKREIVLLVGVCTQI